MFDKAVIEEYKNVAAPTNLKDRVMKTYQTENTRKSNVFMYKSLSLVAACLVLVIAVSTFVGRSGSRISVSVNGSQVSEEPIEIVGAGVAMATFSRNVQAQMNIPLDVDLSSESEITVSGGEISIFDSETGELLFSGTTYSAKGTVSVQWSVSADEADVLSMSITNESIARTLYLEHEETGDVWTIYEK